MTNEAEEYSFSDFMQQGAVCQSELFEVYKSSIGLINDLKNRSRRYMALLSDIEGETLGVEEADNNLESNLARLTTSINSFNIEIGDKSDSFTIIFSQMIVVYSKAINAYEVAEGQLTKMLETRKQVLFLKALIRKYKFKINSLQLMNNALLSLSDDLKDAKDAYRSNLIQLSTVMTSAIEDANHLVEEIDDMTSSK